MSHAIQAYVVASSYDAAAEWGRAHGLGPLDVRIVFAARQLRGLLGVKLAYVIREGDDVTTDLHEAIQVGQRLIALGHASFYDTSERGNLTG